MKIQKGWVKIDHMWNLRQDWNYINQNWVNVDFNWAKTELAAIEFTEQVKLSQTEFIQNWRWISETIAVNRVIQDYTKEW